MRPTLVVLCQRMRPNVGGAVSCQPTLPAKMAAPMAHMSVLNYRSVFLNNCKYWKQILRGKISQEKDQCFCPPSRTFVSNWRLMSPRTFGRTDVSREHGAAAVKPERERAAAVDRPTDDVRIYGDSTGASMPFRRRVEKEVLSAPDDAPVTAKTVAMKIRKEQILKRKMEQTPTGSVTPEKHEQTNATQSGVNKMKDFDSKGFRNLRHQVQDLSRFQEDTVASILFRSVIYNEGELVAIDKPYGLPSHGGPGVIHSVDSLLPLLAKKLRLQKMSSNPKLYLVHRLDKETTGVMLLAKTESMARRLHGMFIRHQVGKKYWVVTVGVPDPRDGIIDMPMIEREVAGKHRMGIRPDIGAVYKNLGKLGGKGGTKAVTGFRVISENGSAALVEVQPQTGVKHQIRVHMALGMGCPVLGDHKYSHHDKLAPQRLPMAILQRLDIRQAKARTVPMHLHAREISLPEFLHDKHLYIATRVPTFFEQNMRRLKLKVG